MRRISHRKLVVSTETVRVLSGFVLASVLGGEADQSIIYGCPGNTSVARSCFENTCAPSGTYVCPMTVVGPVDA